MRTDIESQCLANMQHIDQAVNPTETSLQFLCTEAFVVVKVHKPSLHHNDIRGLFVDLTVI